MWKLQGLSWPLQEPMTASTGERLRTSHFKILLCLLRLFFLLFQLQLLFLFLSNFHLNKCTEIMNKEQQEKKPISSSVLSQEAWDPQSAHIFFSLVFSFLPFFLLTFPCSFWNFVTQSIRIRAVNSGMADRTSQLRVLPFRCNIFWKF